jgi:hypothetical protein
MKRRVILALSWASVFLCILTAGFWLFHIDAPFEDELIPLSSPRLEYGFARRLQTGSHFGGGHRVGGVTGLVLGYYRPFTSPVVGPPNPVVFFNLDGRPQARSGYTPEGSKFYFDWMVRGKRIDLVVVHWNRFYVRNFASSYPPQDGRESIMGRSDTVTIPISIVFLLATIPAWKIVSRARVLLESRRLAQIGRCRICGYDLRASPDRCPECGNRKADSVT